MSEAHMFNYEPEVDVNSKVLCDFDEIVEHLKVGCPLKFPTIFNILVEAAKGKFLPNVKTVPKASPIHSNQKYFYVLQKRPAHKTGKTNTIKKDNSIINVIPGNRGFHRTQQQGNEKLFIQPRQAQGLAGKRHSSSESEIKQLYGSSYTQNKTVNETEEGSTEVKSYSVTYQGFHNGEVWWSKEHGELLGIVARHMSRKVRKVNKAKRNNNESIGDLKTQREHGYCGKWFSLLKRESIDKTIPIRELHVTNVPSFVQFYNFNNLRIQRQLALKASRNYNKKLQSQNWNTQSNADYADTRKQHLGQNYEITHFQNMQFLKTNPPHDSQADPTIWEAPRIKRQRLENSTVQLNSNPSVYKEQINHITENPIVLDPNNSVQPVAIQNGNVQPHSKTTRIVTMKVELTEDGSVRVPRSVVIKGDLIVQGNLTVENLTVQGKINVTNLKQSRRY